MSRAGEGSSQSEWTLSQANQTNQAGFEGEIGFVLRAKHVLSSPFGRHTAKRGQVRFHTLVLFIVVLSRLNNRTKLQRDPINTANVTDDDIVGFR